MSGEPSRADLFKAALGDRIYVWRLALLMSRSELAEKSGLSSDYIYRLEQGWANPRVTTLQALAAALDTTPHELLDVSAEDLGVATFGGR